MNVSIYQRSLIAIWSRVAPKNCAKHVLELPFVPKNNYPFKRLPPADSTLFISDETTLSHWLGENDKAILLVPGWNGYGDQFSEVFDEFRKKGYSIYIVQSKGFGFSQSKSSKPIQFIKSIKQSLPYIHEPLSATIGHGSGAAFVLNVASHRIDLGKIILVSCPSDLKSYFQMEYSNYAVSEACINSMNQGLSRKFKNVKTNLGMCIGQSSSNTDFLIIHDDSDEVVSVSHARALSRYSIKSELHITRGLGHRRILKSRSVCKKMLSFCS